MNTKIGKCIDCPDSEHAKPLVAKRCQLHYWEYRRKINATKPAKAKKTAKAQGVASFFDTIMQNKVMGKCQECGKRLPTGPKWLVKACLAHILPKRDTFGFPSVATNADNIIFLCPDCHTNMDNLGAEYAMKMKCLPLMKERVKLLIPLMTEQEVNRIPAHLL